MKMNFLAMFTFFLMDVDSEEIFHGTFIFEKKILGQVFDWVVCDCCILGKDAAIICVKTNHSIFSNEETWVSFAWHKTLSLETCRKVQKPIAGCLIAATEVAFELDAMLGVSEFWIVRLDKTV